MHDYGARFSPRPPHREGLAETVQFVWGRDDDRVPLRSRDINVPFIGEVKNACSEIPQGVSQAHWSDPRCAGRMQLMATIDAPVVIQRIVAQFGLPGARAGPPSLSSGAAARAEQPALPDMTL